MKINHLYITILFTTLFIVSCTEDLDTDYLGISDNLLVVDGKITTDTTAHVVYLSRTIDYNSIELPSESGATVTITDGDIVFPLTESSFEPGKYLTDSTVYGEVGKRYTLNITLKNGDFYSASDSIRSVVDFDSILVRGEDFDFLKDSVYIAYFFGAEDPEPGNYYRWDLYLNDTLYSDTLKNVNFQSDEAVNGGYISFFDVYWLDEEDITSDTVKVTMEMASITEDYYDFLIAVMQETEWRGGFFDPTPANVPTNVTNGGVGFFRASAVKRETVRYVVQTGENIKD